MATSVIKTTVRKTSAPAGVKTKTTKTARAVARGVEVPPMGMAWDTLELVLADQVMTTYLDEFGHLSPAGAVEKAVEHGYIYADRVIAARRKFLAENVELK